MHLLCLDCYEVYRLTKMVESKQCPKATCAGNLIHVDELLIPAIITLNKKGYITTGCCSTHILGPIPSNPNRRLYGSNEIWIHFKKGEVTIPNAPQGFDVELLGPTGEDKVTRLQEKEYDIEKLSVPERQRHVFNNIINLTEWAESLPILNQNPK